jgi:hypothetical protein
MCSLWIVYYKHKFIIAINFFLSLAVFRFILNKLPFKWYKMSLLQVFFIIACSFSLFFVWLQNDRDIRLLIKFLTVYTCITFHLFALALGEKGVFYSYKKISMLHFCNEIKMHSETEFCSGNKLSLYDQ